MKHEMIIGKYTLESLTNGMYASPFDMYREYIQNSVDSFDDAVEAGIELAGKLAIEITVDRIGRTIVIRDNGCGLRARDAERTLLDIGNSQKKSVSSRGFRGIGRLAGLSYCEKLAFKTSYKGEETATVIEFDASLLKEMLLPGSQNSVSVEDVMNRIVTVRTEKETANRRYFQVTLEGVWNEAGLTDLAAVREYLVQHAPLCFSSSFKWGRTVVEKLRLSGYCIPQYMIKLNGEALYKPYSDTFISDRLKKNLDVISDVRIVTFRRGDRLSAVLWYADTGFFGTIIDNAIKGIRIRQGNILIGDKGTCSLFFKEERFNGWLIGELYVVDKDIIANSRRDGFEKNAAYYELLSMLRDWAFEISKEIRRLSYERSILSQKKVMPEVEQEQPDGANDENSLYSEDMAYAEDDVKSADWSDESDEPLETDYITRLGLLLNRKKVQTKYTALNINEKLTIEQRKVLERVFDLILRDYDRPTAERFIDTISKEF